MLFGGLQTIGLPNCSVLPEANGGEAPECFIPFNSTLTELPPGSPKSKYTVCVLVSYNYIVIQPVCVYGCVCLCVHSCVRARAACALRVCTYIARVSVCCTCVARVCMCVCVCVCVCVYVCVYV